GAGVRRLRRGWRSRGEKGIKAVHRHYERRLKMLQRRQSSSARSNDEPDRLRRGIALSLVMGAFTTAVSGHLLAAPADKPAPNKPIEVWTGPSCGCCKEWVKHLQDNGFNVVSHEGGNSEARKRLGMP